MAVDLDEIDWSGRLTVFSTPFALRPKTITAVKCYILGGIIPTGFVRYVLAGDLKSVMGWLDMYDFMELPALGWWLHENAPGECWGSVGAVADWSRARQGGFQGSEG